ncbi:cilia- and flagella-associated protein 251 [Nothobranchius furzeri]|uniref:Cilia- and flagella-associated protein 251 n=5 Tax=Nothobranchius TaxID=28779 RepID=A0A9D2XDH7_NOTFU|nr:cilia- and flagella-associated protein 251 [Nothobranchius furzeri]XP_015828164.1 cilia- and flagella-associated protein 251 [Nothobranchius furzeri]KAF7200353.1 transcript variant X1 [Nothobranchius furzeri]KAF7200354.1 transcript variant X2 [Nothobranchius furzeri]
MSESEAKEQDPATSTDLQQAAGKTQESQPSEDEGNPVKSTDEVGVRKAEPNPNKLKMTGRSQVYTSTKETLFLNNRTHPSTHGLSPVWIFGKNPALPVFNVQDHDQLVFLSAAANVGVLYNHTSNSQHILRGHSQSISCMCVSEDRRWIATGDNGSKGWVIIWDSYSGIPVQTFFDCFVGGLTALAFSSDTKHLATVSGEEVQCVHIWDWSKKAAKLLSWTELHPKYGLQDYISFKPNDSMQLLSSSKNHMVFYSMTKGSLRYFALNLKKLVGSVVFTQPFPLSPKRVPLAEVSLSRSVFHCTKSQVLMAIGGILVMMDVSEDLVERQNLPSSKIKKINHQQDPITALTMVDGCGVIGNVKGQIKFFDVNFKFLRWFVDLSLDPIVFISFSNECADEFVEDLSLEGKPFILRNFTVLTISSKVVHVNAQRDFSQTLLHEAGEPLYAVACHPSQPTVVMGNQLGILQMWDYNKKVPIGDKVFMTEKGIHCVTFDPKGLYLAVGFGSGVVIILNSHTLQSDPEEIFHYTTDSIHLITFSADSQYLAAADTGNAVTVFRLQRLEGSLSRWTYLGRYGSHYKPIKDLLFGVHLDSNQPRLLSLGMDRKLVEYDLKNSSVNELLILNSEQIEQSATPLCMTWYPPLTTEHFLLVASDQYKMKLFNSTTKMCRQTVLGPVFGSPVKKMVVLPKLDEPEVKSHHLAYITEDELGLQILPLDGNPHKSTAFIGHPTGAAALACSYDGCFVCTAGGSDCTVILWEINLKVLEATAALGGKDMEPFYNLLEGGADGRVYKEIENYFYYCQIIDQGHSSKRQPSTKIPLSQVPFLMRALGYFLSEKEINDMQNEIKFSKYAETRKYVNEIGIEDFVKLYINHRPVVASSSRELLQAFNVLGKTGSTGQPVLQRSDLMTLLKGQGEHMTEKEVSECLTTLLSLDEEEEEETEGAHCADSENLLECVIPDELSMKTLTQILGFPFLEEMSTRSSLPE